MISEECIQTIKDKVDIVDIIGSFIKIKREGKDYVAKCPFHTERTPSFKISPEKGIYKCFGCNKSGDAIAFLMDYQQMPYVGALNWIAKRYHVEIEETGILKEYSKPIPRLEKLRPEVIKRFEQRGISNNTLLRFNISESIEWMPQFNKEVPCVCFNYYRNEELVNIKFRGPDKSFKLAKDAELIFYNLNSIHEQETCVIVEGEMDCLSLHECGIYNVVSVPNGAAKGNQKLDYLDNCWKYFEGKKKVVLMVDDDTAGYSLREELARRIGKEICYKVTYPEGCKDANEVLVKYGKDAVIELYESAILWPIEGILTMDDMFEDVVNYYEHGYPMGVKMGIPQFDELISFMPGQMTIVTGIPGSGKSEFIDWLMCSSAKYHQWPWGICSFENQPSALHVTKLMEKFAGKSFAFRKNIENRMNFEEFRLTTSLVDKFFHFVNINQVDVTLEGLLNKSRELVVRKGIKGLLIDPWNYIEHKVPKGYTETQYISESLTEIKAFAIKTGTHVFLIAHPTKLKKETNGKYEVPTLYNISGSAHFFNKTDNGITVYRDFETNNVDVYVQKIRYSWLGKIGYCSFKYSTETRQYSVLQKDTTEGWTAYAN